MQGESLNTVSTQLVRPYANIINIEKLHADCVVMLARIASIFYIT